MRALLEMAIPESFRPKILQLVHCSKLPLDQLVEAASSLCYSVYHVGEVLEYKAAKDTKAKGFVLFRVQISY